MARATSPSAGRGLSPVLAAVVLVVLLALAWIALVTALTGPDSADESPPPATSVGGAGASGSSASPRTPPSTASAGPPSAGLPSAGPDEIVVGSLVEATADGLQVMESAGLGATPVGVLPAGQPALIVSGPAERDGFTWYLLSGLGLPPNTGCEEPYTIADCPGWIGWVPLDEEVASLTPVVPECADPSNYLDFARQSPLLQLVCMGNRAVKLTAWWAGPSPFHVCIDSPPGVDWLYCAAALHGWLAPSPDDVGITWLAVAVDPASGVVLQEPGRWVEVTGHFDDPAATACNVVPGAPDAELAAWGQVLQCRSTLVVESMVEVAGG
ncbi:MAG TPA: hypothetical protein VFO73_15430 [Candidatus Limnocylindrales bacterium]|nr:hypothetical protein [Candidatus Limnocylindrales bacterium]